MIIVQIIVVLAVFLMHALNECFILSPGSLFLYCNMPAPKEQDLFFFTALKPACLYAVAPGGC